MLTPRVHICPLQVNLQLDPGVDLYLQVQER